MQPLYVCAGACDSIFSFPVYTVLAHILLSKHQNKTKLKIFETRLAEKLRSLTTLIRCIYRTVTHFTGMVCIDDGKKLRASRRRLWEK